MTDGRDFSFSVTVSGVCSYHLSTTLILCSLYIADFLVDVRGSFIASMYVLRLSKFRAATCDVINGFFVVVANSVHRVDVLVQSSWQKISLPSFDLGLRQAGLPFLPQAQHLLAICELSCNPHLPLVASSRVLSMQWFFFPFLDSIHLSLFF